MSKQRRPAMYLPHGGGPSFFMTGERKHRYQATEHFLREVPPSLLPEKPDAILIATAHWETDQPTFTGGEHPHLIYDY